MKKEESPFYVDADGTLMEFEVLRGLSYIKISNVFAVVDHEAVGNPQAAAQQLRRLWHRQRGEVGHPIQAGHHVQWYGMDSVL